MNTGTTLLQHETVSQILRLRRNDSASSPVTAGAGQFGCIATHTSARGFSCSLLGQSNSFHTYAGRAGIAYFPLLVSTAPFGLGSFPSTMELHGIPLLFLSLGTGSEVLSC